MREYGQIQSAFWQAPDITGLTDHAKLLATFLLTGPATNGIGCFAMGNGLVADSLGWAAPFIEERFMELSRNGFAYRFGTVVFIPNFLRWNRIANGNVAKARFQEWEQVPKSSAKAYAARAMLRFSDFWTDDHRTVLETVSQTVSETVITEVENQNPIQPNPIQPNPTPLSSKSTKPKSAPVPDGFVQFWDTYPRKEGKGAAIKAYAKTTEAERRVIATVLPLFVQSWKWLNEPQYIPHPATWLNQRRWEDDPPSKLPPHQPKMTHSESRQARQLRVLEETANDPRYQNTADRQLAYEHHSSWPATPGDVEPAMDASAGRSSWDDDGLD